MAWAEPQPGGGFRGRYRLPGNPKVKPTVLRPDGSAFETKPKAKKAAIAAEELAKRKAPRHQKHLSLQASTTWGEWWDILSAEREFEGTNSGAIERSIAKNHLLPFWGNVPMNMIVTKQPDFGTDQVGIQEWVDSDPGLKIRKGMSPAYASRIFSTFGMSLNAAVPRILDFSPSRGVKLHRVPKKKRPYATPDKISGLNLRGDYQDILTFAAETGLRPGEVCGLHAASCDLKQKVITVCDVFVTELNIIRHFPKDDDHRQVPITPTAEEILRRQFEGRSRNLRSKCPWPHVRGTCPGALAFMTERGKPFRPKNVRGILGTAEKNVDVPSLRGMYSTRHGFGTRAANGDLNVFELADIMGHSDVSITRGYYQGSTKTRQRLTAALANADSD